MGRMAVAAPPESLDPASRPVVALSFDAPSTGVPGDRLRARQNGKALAVQDRGVIVEAPADFSWEQGSVEMAIRPDFDCKDDTYHMFFDVRGPGKSAVYLIKSGTGGANGLFLCVIDAKGQWMSAMAGAGGGYSWRKGEWHRIGGSWHGGRGLIKLFFDGKEIAERRVAPFRVGVSSRAFAIGASVSQGQFATGLVDDFRLYSEMSTQTPVAGAASVLGDHHAWRAIDGDRADGAQWEGTGCPNWLEIELPRPEEIARVVVHPGDRRHAGYPSTERSPKTYRLQGWIDSRWHDLTGDIHPPAYQARSDKNLLAHQFPARRMRKFRLLTTEFMDEGKRIDGRVLPEGERSVVIREVEWFTATQLQEQRQRREHLRREVVSGAEEFQKHLDSSDRPNRLSEALAQRYGDALTELKQSVADADWLDSEAMKRIEQRWASLRGELTPWVSALAVPEPPLADWIGPGQHGLLVEVTGLTDAHSFYPISVPLDLELLEQTWGVELDPYEVWVAAVDAQEGKLVPWEKGREGEPAYRCPSRFERETPKRGRLSWVVRDSSLHQFLVTFGSRPEAPPELGNVTLGNGDRHYYDRTEHTLLPGPVTSAAIVDWDGDGKQDLLCGTWPDHVHFWRNVGTQEHMSFSEREHYRLRDEDGNPILAYPEHPGLGFSYVTPIDVDGDKLEDLFVNRVYGSMPKFYRSLGPREFPRLSRGRTVPGLGAGRYAFGDLNGDGRVDAVSTRTQNGKQMLLWQPGTELTADGTPTFAQPKTVEVADKPLVTDSGYVFPALADLDADGDLDLSYYVNWGHVYTCKNVGGRSEPRFADPQQLMLGEEPLDIGSYHNAIRWGDVDSDGDLDLIVTTGVRIYRNDGDRQTVRLTEQWSPRHIRQVEVGRHRLQGFSFVDWDADGDLDRVMTRSHNLDLEVELFENGHFREQKVVDIDPNKDDWYGCPDPTEYRALYSNTRLVDWDVDGDLDLFATSEHGWRFGYIHHYENLGDGTFGPEREFRPGGTCDYVRFVDGKAGQAIQVDENTYVDYLSYPVAGNFDPSGGTISLWFQPNWDSGRGTPHYLIHAEPNPAKSLDTRSLHRVYRREQEGLDIAPGFALLETKEGTLRLDLWDRQLETPKLDWKKGQWHRVEVQWGKDGARIVVDDAELVHEATPAEPGEVGRRFFIGSRSVRFVQPQREYRGRIKYHPKPWIFPAQGAIDEVAIRGSDSKSLLTLSFDGHCDGADGESGNRLRVGYRCTPDFADFTGDDLLDMVMMFGNGARHGWGQLYLFRNIGTRQQPRLADPIPLCHRDGKPISCFYRTMITCADWDADGLSDIFLSTEHTTASPDSIPNQGIDFYRNQGTQTEPAFGPRTRFQKIIDAIQPWHEVKLAVVDLTGNGQLDIVASADSGSYVFTRSYLEVQPPTVRFTGLYTRQAAALARSKHR